MSLGSVASYPAQASQFSLPVSQPAPSDVEHYYRHIESRFKDRETSHEIIGIDPSNPETAWQALGAAINQLLNAGKIASYAFGNEGKTLLIQVQPTDHLSLSPLLQASTDWFSLQKPGPLVPAQFAEMPVVEALTDTQIRLVGEIQDLIKNGQNKVLVLNPYQFGHMYSFQFGHMVRNAPSPTADLRKAIRYLVYQEKSVLAYAHGKERDSFLLMAKEGDSHTPETQERLGSDWFSCGNREKNILLSAIHKVIEKGEKKVLVLHPRDFRGILETDDPVKELKTALVRMVFEEKSVAAYAYGNSGGTFLIMAKAGDAHTQETQEECASKWFSLQNPEKMTSFLTGQTPTEMSGLTEKDMLRMLYQGRDKRERALTVAQLESLVPEIERYARDGAYQETEFNNTNPYVILFPHSKIFNLDRSQLPILLGYLVLTHRAAAYSEGAGAVLFLTPQAFDRKSNVFTQDRIRAMDEQLKAVKRSRPLIPIGSDPEYVRLFNKCFESLRMAHAVLLRKGKYQAEQLDFGFVSRKTSEVVLTDFVNNGLIHAWAREKKDYTSFAVKIHAEDEQPESLAIDRWWDKEALLKGVAFKQANKVEISPFLAIPSEMERRLVEIVVELNEHRRQPGPYQLENTREEDQQVLEFAKRNHLIHDYNFQVQETGHWKVCTATICVKSSDVI
jgi:hypothetical protein